MAINDKLSKPGLIPVKVENQGSLITTQVNKINFTGSGVTASIGQFNDLTVLITGGGGSGISSSYALSASYADTASYFSGSISNAISSSYALSSSFALTASYFSGSISNAISASYAATSSYSSNLIISGSINNVDYIDFNTASAVPAWKSGRVFWDNTDGALSVYNAEQDITLQVGQENWTRVSNRTGATILNGTVVRLLGAHGDVPEVELAQSSLISGSVNSQNQILGIATHDIEDNSKGYVTTQGLVRGLNTNAFNDGDTLFVGTGSAGVLQNTAPVAPYEIIPVGVCVKASPGTSGIIYVAVQQPYDFSDLSSVLVTGSYDYGDLWTYIPSGSTGVWTHTNQLSGSYGITGSLRVTGSIFSTRVTASSFTGSFTGSLLGTGSWAVSASQAVTASYILNAISASYALSSSFAATSSYINVLSQSVLITGSLGLTGSLNIFKSGSTVVDIQGSSGQLFSITDSLTGSLFSVNTVAGLPIVEAFSDNTVNIGKFGVYPIKVVATGTLAQITGSFTGSVTGALTGTASFATTASWALNSRLLNGTSSFGFATTSSNSFTGSQEISGSVGITGSLTVSGPSVDVNLTATNIILNAGTLRAPLLPVSSPPGGALLSTVLIDQLNGTLYVTSSLPGGGGGSGLADRIQTGSITASVSDGTFPQPYFFLLQSGSREMLKFNTEGVMQLESYTTTPTAITGGIFYSASGEFFFGL